MRRVMRKIALLLCAVCMLSGSERAFAETGPYQELEPPTGASSHAGVSGYSEIAGDAPQGDTRYAGYISPHIISVAIPSQISLSVDPSQQLAAENHFSQITNPSDAYVTVQNNGVDLRLEIIGVSDWTKESQDITGRWRNFQFVDKLDNMPVPSALLALRTKETPPNSLEALQAFAVTPEKFAGNRHMEVARIPGGKSTVLQVYGAVGADYRTPKLAFSITPTIKASYISADDESD